MNLSDKHIVVVGLKTTGIALTRAIISRGGRVTVSDQADRSTLGELGDQVEAMGATLDTGGHTPSLFTSCDMVVLSPGVPHTLPFLEKARQAGIPVIGEIELAFRGIDCPVVAITGTNGKTTTTTLVGDMLRASGKSVFVGGNIGTPLISLWDTKEKPDVAVVEMSSFQLDTIETFKPHVAVLLNITDDHLDRYADMDGYIASKLRIFENQNKDDFAIYDGSQHGRQWHIFHSEAQQLQVHADDHHLGASLQDSGVEIQGPDGGLVSLDLTQFRLKGRHNAENLAAAALAALCAGGSEAGIKQAIKNFTGLPHRLEYCGEKDKVTFYNDSKATNIDAAIKAISGLKGPVIPIMGGRFKGGDLSTLEAAVKAYAKEIILIGEAATQFENALKSSVPVHQTESMDAAVKKAWEIADAGDAIVLAPACSSFDMFDNYQHRGEAFKNATDRIIRR